MATAEKFVFTNALVGESNPVPTMVHVAKNWDAPTETVTIEACSLYKAARYLREFYWAAPMGFIGTVEELDRSTR